MDLDAQLLLLAGAAPPIKQQKQRKQPKKYTSDSDEVSRNSDSSVSSHFSDKLEFGPDLMGDDKDRARLALMTEVERESILAERSERRLQHLERLEIKKKLRAGQQKKSSTSAIIDDDYFSDNDDRRKSSRRALDRSKKTQSLSALKKNRERKSKRSNHPSDDDSEDGEIMYKEEAVSEKSEINPIQVTRDELEKWCYAPFFKNAVKDTFVRIGLGTDSQSRDRVYRICKILDVLEYHKIYTIGSTQTKIAISVSHGKAIKTFSMEIVSNSAFTESEWSRYKATLKKEDQPLTSKNMVKKKIGDLVKARAHIFNDAELNEMIAQKKAIKSKPINIANEKLNLQRQLDLAIQNSQEDQIERINRELVNLREYQESSRSESKLDIFAKLNKRNRVINAKEAQEAERIKSYPAAQNGSAGIVVDDSKSAPGSTHIPDYRAVLLDEALLLDDDFFDHIDVGVYALE